LAKAGNEVDRYALLLYSINEWFEEPLYSQHSADFTLTRGECSGADFFSLRIPIKASPSLQAQRSANFAPGSNDDYNLEEFAC
jgi:hypothetical protein